MFLFSKSKTQFTARTQRTGWSFSKVHNAIPTDLLNLSGLKGALRLFFRKFFYAFIRLIGQF